MGRILMAFAVVVALALGTAGCEKKSTSEKVSDAAKSAGQAVKETAKDAGRTVDNAVEDAGEAVEDATK